MKTRRSKGNENTRNAAADDTSQFQVEIPEDLDVEQLSSIFPDTSFSTPSSNDVSMLYKFILDQARDVKSLTVQLEEARSDALKKEVELDQTLQEHELRYKEQEEALAARTEEAEKLRVERKSFATTQAALESERTELSKSQSLVTLEVGRLKLSLTELDREKRDLVGVIARLRTDDEHRENEVGNLRETLKQVRRDFQDIQSQLSEARATETTHKFKIQHLEQQLELAQNTSEATNAELQQKSEEFANYRRDKHAEVVKLSSSLDTISATHSATQSTLEALQQSYNNQSRQLTQAYQKITDVEGQLADSTASYRSEASNQARLIEMLESRNEQARVRVEEVESEWEQMVNAAEEREAKLSADLERERSRADRLDVALGKFHAQREIASGDVVNDAGDLSSASTPGRERAVFSLSPAAGVAARLQKTGKSFTEVYADYVRVQEELAQSQSEKRRLEELLSQVLADLEERTPLLAQQRQDFERAKQEADQLANQLAQTLTERDSLKLHSADMEKQLQSGRLLITELEQSGMDLGRQVQHLTRQITILENPALESVPLLPAANSELLSAELALGSDEVVLFQNLASLQTQNQILLKIAHSSAVALDQKEREFNEALEKEETEAIREANEAIAILEDQLASQAKSYQLKLQAYTRELDLYKSTQRRNRPVENSVGDASKLVYSDSPSATELRAQFDAYKLETELDATRLREQLDKLQQEANRTIADLAKANGTVQFLNDRHRMQNEGQQLKERELRTLNQRCQDLRDQCTRLELAYSQATENLTQAHSTIERLRTESANLRAERTIWKDIESRLVSENRSLSKERSQLADLVSNVQRMHDDLDRANEHDRTRQEGQLQTLEAQVQDLRSQLSQEREALRSATVHKDIELKDLHERLERSVKEHNVVSQALAVAEAKRKHLQERFDEVSRQSEAQREKLSIYERRPAIDSASTANDSGDAAFQVQTEIIQLSADLKAAQMELARSREHVEQYKSISESNEQAFQQLTVTFDELQASSRSQMADKDVEVQSLVGKLGKAQDDIGLLERKNVELQRILDSERLAYKKEQQSLETKIVEMTTVAVNFHSDNTARVSAVQEQEQRAQLAERKYEEAIKSHADAINVADKLKEQLTAARLSSRENQTKADTAESRMTMMESSWNSQKLILDKEMADVNRRCQELTEQNEMLHHQLETLSAQASRIRHLATSAAEINSNSDKQSDAVDQQLADLRSVISFLRKEKDIVDLQLEVSKQEAARSKTESAHLSRILEETRTLLSEEREKATQSATSAAEHAELLERINQLNLLRESNATLRAEGSSNKQRVTQLEGDVAALSSELEPLRQRFTVLMAEVEAKDTQISQLKEEAQHWQERNRQILGKYDRIDPAEIQQLKDQAEHASARIAEIEAQKEEIQKHSAEQSETTEKYKKNVQLHREALNKLRAQFKAQKEELEQQKQQFTRELESLRAERDSLQSKIDTELSSELAELRSRIQSLTDECHSLKLAAEEENKRSKTQQAEPEDHTTSDLLATVTAERDALASAKKALEEQMSSLSSASNLVESLTPDEKATLVKAKEDAEKIAAESQERQASAEEQIKTIRARAQALAQELQVAKGKVANLEKEHSNAQQSIDSLTKQHEETLQKAIAEAKQKALAESSGEPNQSELLRQLDDLKAHHQQELDALRASLTVTAGSGNDAEVARLNVALDKANADLEKLRSEIESLHKEKEDAKAQGIDQGRREMAAKVKLKDSAISKKEAMVKDLSKKLQEVEQALVASTNGVYKPEGASTSGTLAGAGLTTGVPASPVVSSSNATLTSQPASPSSAGPPTSVRGRGVALRGAATRGRGVTRGGTAAAVNPPATSGTSIIGAAAKRGRDGDTEPQADALVKRLKPSGGPITLNRNRPLPPETGT